MQKLRDGLERAKAVDACDIQTRATEWVHHDATKKKRARGRQKTIDAVRFIAKRLIKSFADFYSGSHFSLM